MIKWSETQTVSVSVRLNPDEVEDVTTVLGKRFRPDQLNVIYTRSRNSAALDYTPWSAEAPVVSGVTYRADGSAGTARVRERVFERFPWLRRVVEERMPDA